MIMEFQPKIWDAERMVVVGFNRGGKSGSCPESLTRRDERVEFIGALTMEIAVQQRKTRNISSLRKGW